MLCSQCYVVSNTLKTPPLLSANGGTNMTTVTYDVVLSMTVEVDADDLIEESARSLIESCADDIGMADIHDIEISAA